MLLCMYSRKCSLLSYDLAFTHRKASPMMIEGNNPHICVRDFTDVQRYEGSNRCGSWMCIEVCLPGTGTETRNGDERWIIFVPFLFHFQDCFGCLAGGSCFAIFASSTACVVLCLAFVAVSPCVASAACLCVFARVTFCFPFYLAYASIESRCWFVCVAFWRRHGWRKLKQENQKEEHPLPGVYKSIGTTRARARTARTRRETRTIRSTRKNKEDNTINNKQ